MFFIIQNAVTYDIRLRVFTAKQSLRWILDGAEGKKLDKYVSVNIKPTSALCKSDKDTLYILLENSIIQKMWIILEK